MSFRPRPQSVAALVLPLACCACGGGGGGGTATLAVGFAESNFTLDEDGGTATIALTLQGPVGTTLVESAAVVVSDAGTGTATSGVDYASFAPVAFTVPAGTPVGTTLEVELTPLGDDLVEGAPETVVLVLGGPLGVPSTASVELDDGETAVLRFTSAAQTTPDEGPAQHVATVQLDLPGACTLAVELGVDVGDDGVGTATAGADYAAVATTRVTFAAGSPDGATHTVGVGLLDDTLIEGSESVRLALSSPDAGAVLGATALHQIVIQDDETPTGKFLYVSQGPGGTESPLAHGSPVALGSQGLGDGPNAGTLVRLSNIGTSSFGVAAPTLAGEHPEDFSIELESAPLPARAGAIDPGDPAFVLADDAPAPVGARLPADRGVAFELDALLLAGLEALQQVTLHGFPLPGRPDGTLALSRVALPFSADALLVVDGVAQAGGPAALLADLTLWSGTVLEQPGSRVFLALSAAGAQGFLEFPDSAERLVHVVTEAPPGADGTPARVRVVEDSELEALGVLPPPQACAEARSVPGTSELPGAGALLGDAGPGSEALSVANCRVAIETDYQLYQRFGSSVALSTYVASLMAAVSERYVTDVQAQLTVSYLGIYTSAADPWSAQDSGGDAGDVLDEFRAAWTDSGWPASAALAHFLSGANLGGGVAYLNVLCNQSYGFGVSGNVVGNINWGAWSGASGSFTWDFVVVAHELGHNFGAGHTHSYCPPLDQCYSNCSNSTVCGPGTLMSYCHLCAGGMGNIELSFHPVVANIMRTAINSSCLGYSLLSGGDHVQYLVRFAPQSATGLRTAELRFVHGAPNHPSPLCLQLSGQAQP